MNASEHRAKWERDYPDIPYGFCVCGCGERTRLSDRTRPEHGHVEGCPVYCIKWHRRRTLSKAQEIEACQQYHEGGTTHDLARKWGISKTTAKRLLKRNGVALRSSGARRTHTCDDAFFDAIDNEAKAYWLGFVAADGCVTRNNLTFGLQARDSEHLERLRNALKATNPISVYRNKKGYGVAQLTITSKILTAGLQANGIARRKSKVLEWPHFLHTSLLKHYLRGYFDGDGWFSVAKNAYVRKSDGERNSALVWGIIGTPTFCADAQEFLIREANTSPKVGLHSHPLTDAVVHLSYGGNLQVSRIYHLLYDDASVWLPRKRETARPHLRDTRETSARPDRRALSSTAVDEAARLRQTGLSYQAIGDRLKVNRETVRNVLKHGYHTSF